MNAITINTNLRWLVRQVARLTTTGWAVVLIWLSLIATPTTVNAQVESVKLTKINGETVEGRIDSVEFEELAIRTANDVRTFSFEEISKIDFGIPSQRPLEPFSRVQLVDGSELNVESIGIVSNLLKVDLLAGQSIELNSRIVEWVRFKTYDNELTLAKQWRSIVEDDSRQGDAIVINRSGELDTVEGIIGDIAEEKLSFSIEDRSARVPLSKMDAVLFYHASGREFGPPICNLVLADQSSLRMKKLQWKNATLMGQTVCGADVEFSPDQISRLDFSLGRDVLLSSLEPTTNDWQPLLTSSAIFEKLRRMKLARTNESFSGEPLSLKFHTESELPFLAKIKQFENGFAIQGGGKLAFALNGQYEKLTGLVGFDPNANASGNVRFVVLLDGKTVLEKEMINRNLKNPIELDLNVKDVSRVVLQVDYNDGRSTGDQIHLVDLRVAQ